MKKPAGPRSRAGYGGKHSNFQLEKDSFTGRAMKLLQDMKDPKATDSMKRLARQTLSQLIGVQESDLRISERELRASRARVKEKEEARKLVEIEKARLEIIKALFRGETLDSQFVRMYAQKIMALEGK
jgi:hypothetical protein